MPNELDQFKLPTASSELDQFKLPQSSDLEQFKLTPSQTPVVTKPKSLFARAYDALGKVGGAMQSTGTALASPVTRTLATAQRASRGATALAGAGGRYLAGDQEEAAKILEREGQKQLKEEAKDIALRPVDTAREAVGVGVELGTTLMTPSAAALGLPGGVFSGALTGGLSGLSYGFGKGMETAGAERSGLKETVTKTAVGTVVGGVAGAATGALLGGLMKGLEKRDIKLREKGATKAAMKAAKVKLAGPGATTPEELGAHRAVDDAVKQGFKVKDVDLVNGMTKEDKLAAVKMTEMADEGIKSYRAPNYREVVAEPILDGLKAADDSRRWAGGEMQKALTDMGKQPFQLGDKGDDFIKGLTDDGVTIGDDGQLDFSASAYKRLKDVQGFLQEAYDAMTGSATNLDAHRSRMGLRIANDLAKDQGLLKGRPETLLDMAYDAIGDALGDMSPAYKEASDIYAKSVGAIQPWEKMMGQRFLDQPENIQALRAAEIANRLQSNSSANTEAALSKLDQIVPGLAGRVRDRAAVGGIIEDFWQLTPDRSLRGQVEKGATEAGAALLKSKSGLWMNLIRKAVDVTMGRDPALAREAFRKLLETSLKGL